MSRASPVPYSLKPHLELDLAPRKAATHCSYCAVGCAMELSETSLGTVEAKGIAHPINRGKLCVLGQSSAGLLKHGERLTQPLVRVKGELVVTTWEAALTYAAAGFDKIRTAHGPAANPVYSGASITNEKTYLIGKFARVALQTPNVDYNGRYCISAAATAANKAFGLDRGLNMTFEDIKTHDLILIIGGNVAECLPIMMNHLMDAKAAGTRFVTVDPRRTITANLAALHLNVKPGGDLALASGLLKWILEHGRHDPAFIAARTSGFGAFVLGSNPVASSPNAGAVKGHLETLKHLVVDSFMSETAQFAHVVLSGPLWAEESGTTTNLEGRVLLRQALRLSPAGARRDHDIIQDLAARLGAGAAFDFETPEDVFNELRRTTAGARGGKTCRTSGRSWRRWGSSPGTLTRSLYAPSNRASA